MQATLAAMAMCVTRDFRDIKAEAGRPLAAAEATDIASGIESDFERRLGFRADRSEEDQVASSFVTITDHVAPVMVQESKTESRRRESSFQRPRRGARRHG